MFLVDPASHRNGCIIDQVDLESLPWERETLGFWLDVPEALLHLLIDREINPAGTKCASKVFSAVADSAIDLPEAIHSAQHAVLNCTQKYKELLTECKAPTKEYKVGESRRKRPAR